MRLEEVRRLIRLVEESDIDELDVWRWWGRIRIRKQGAVETIPPPRFAAQPEAPPAFVPPPVPAQAPAGDAAAAEAAARLVPIQSPMVGTFSRAPAPDAEPYVSVGSRVEPGQTVCIIEAMKLMNEIQSEVRGTVAQVLLENSEPVEFGQPLFLIEKS